MLPALAYTLSYVDILILEKNDTRSRILSICRKEAKSGLRIARSGCKTKFSVFNVSDACENKSHEDATGQALRWIKPTASGRLRAISDNWSNMASGNQSLGR